MKKNRQIILFILTLAFSAIQPALLKAEETEFGASWERKLRKQLDAEGKSKEEIHQHIFKERLKFYEKKWAMLLEYKSMSDKRVKKLLEKRLKVTQEFLEMMAQKSRNSQDIEDILNLEVALQKQLVNTPESQQEDKNHQLHMEEAKQIILRLNILKKYQHKFIDQLTPKWKTWFYLGSTDRKLKLIDKINILDDAFKKNLKNQCQQFLTAKGLTGQSLKSLLKIEFDIRLKLLEFSDAEQGEQKEKLIVDIADYVVSNSKFFTKTTADFQKDVVDEWQKWFYCNHEKRQEIWEQLKKEYDDIHKPAPKLPIIKIDPPIEETPATPPPVENKTPSIDPLPPAGGSELVAAYEKNLSSRSVKNLLAAAKYAQKEKSEVDALRLYKEILTIDRFHPKANKYLGHVQLWDVWLTKEEADKITHAVKSDKKNKAIRSLLKQVSAGQEQIAINAMDSLSMMSQGLVYEIAYKKIKKGKTQGLLLKCMEIFHNWSGPRARDLWIFVLSKKRQESSLLALEYLEENLIKGDQETFDYLTRYISKVNNPLCRQKASAVLASFKKN